MQKILEHIAKEIDDFLNQRDNLVLVLHCTDNEAGLIVKLIDDVDNARQAEAFFKFSDDFVILQAYADVVIEKLLLQHRTANKHLKEEHIAPLDPIPTETLSPELSPILRLGNAIQYTRSLRIDNTANNVCWVLFPLSINNIDEYKEFVSVFSPQRGLNEKMQGLRLIFRGVSLNKGETSPFKNLRRVQTYSADISPEAIQKSLNEAAEDESLSDDDRAQSLLQLALIDAAHQRDEKALEHLRYLLGYYQGTKNHTLETIVISSAADIYRKQGDLEKATHVYETAIPPAIESKTPILFYNISRSLADIEFEKKNYPLSEKYYEQCVIISEKILNEEGKAAALEQQGLCAHLQKEKKRAIETWILGLTFCKKMEMEENYKSIKDKLQTIESSVENNLKQTIKKALES